eukprot:5423634-Amphidinium_carterae.1
MGVNTSQHACASDTKGALIGLTSLFVWDSPPFEQFLKKGFSDVVAIGNLVASPCSRPLASGNGFARGLRSPCIAMAMRGGLGCMLWSLPANLGVWPLGRLRSLLDLIPPLHLSLHVHATTILLEFDVARQLLVSHIPSEGAIFLREGGAPWVSSLLLSSCHQL